LLVRKLIVDILAGLLYFRPKRKL